LVKEFNWIYEEKETFGFAVYRITAFSFRATIWIEKPAELQEMLFIKSILQLTSKSLI
jgi:hypothetical protein